MTNIDPPTPEDAATVDWDDVVAEDMADPEYRAHYAQAEAELEFELTAWESRE